MKRQFEDKDITFDAEKEERRRRREMLLAAEMPERDDTESTEIPEDVFKTPYVITHFYESIHPDNGSAEFIRKSSVLHMTKTHGLGSGIYGLTKQTATTQLTRPLNSSKLYPLYHPLVLDTNDKLSCFSQLSIGLMNACESLVKGSDVNELIEDLIEDLQKNQCDVHTIIPSNLHEILYQTVTTWVNDYTNANVNDYLYQPINYLLMGTYDGIFNSSPHGDSFASGSVYFPKDDTEHVPRPQDSAMTKQFKLLEGSKLIPCHPVNLRFGGTPRKLKLANAKRKRTKMKSKRRKSRRRQ